MTTPTTDFSVFDGRELVTYSPAVGLPVADVTAVRRPLTQSRSRNVETFVALEATDVVFHLDAAPLAGLAPAAGDTLVDGVSQDYQVLFIEIQSLGNTAVAVCRLVQSVAQELAWPLQAVAMASARLHRESIS